MSSIAAGVPRTRHTTDEERYKSHLEACKRWYTKKAKPKTESEYGNSYSQDYHKKYYQAHKEKLQAYQLQYREKRKQEREANIIVSSTKIDIAGNVVENPIQ